MEQYNWTLIVIVIFFGLGFIDILYRICSNLYKLYKNKTKQEEESYIKDIEENKKLKQYGKFGNQTKPEFPKIKKGKWFEFKTTIIISAICGVTLLFQ